jgi:predicted TIM-barrel enzyme
MPFIGRETALSRLRAQVAAGRPIVGAGAGTGISAKCAVLGGVDIIIIYNSGRYRMAGRGSLAGLLPYGDANAIVMEMAGEVLPVVKDKPVLAGVCGTDPFRLMPVFLREVKARGFDGVQNFPTVGLIDGTMRQGLEETDMGYDKEVEMIRLAREMDLLTCPYVFNPDRPSPWRAGADVLVPHLGLTTSGTIGAATALTLDESARRHRPCATPRSRSIPTSPCCVMAVPSQNPRMRNTSSTTHRASRILRCEQHRAPGSGAGHRRAGAPVQESAPGLKSDTIIRALARASVSGTRRTAASGRGRPFRPRAKSIR